MVRYCIEFNGVCNLLKMAVLEDKIVTHVWKIVRLQFSLICLSKFNLMQFFDTNAYNAMKLTFKPHLSIFNLLEIYGILSTSLRIWNLCILCNLLHCPWPILQSYNSLCAFTYWKIRYKIHDCALTLTQ